MPNVMVGPIKLADFRLNAALFCADLWKEGTAGGELLVYLTMTLEVLARSSGQFIEPVFDTDIGAICDTLPRTATLIEERIARTKSEPTVPQWWVDLLVEADNRGGAAPVE